MKAAPFGRTAIFGTVWKPAAWAFTRWRAPAGAPLASKRWLKISWS
jgi:hypothetical protein